MIPTIEKLQLLHGKPIPVENVCLIHAVLIEDISSISEQTFFDYLNILTIDPFQVDVDLAEENPLHFLIKMSLIDPSFQKKMQDAFYFFLHEPITILPDMISIMVGDNIEEKRLLTTDNFDTFQNTAKIMYGLSLEKESAPTTERGKEYLRQERKNKLKIQKIKANPKDGKKPLEFGDYVASLAANSNLNILDIFKIPYYAFRDQLQRMRMLEQYEYMLDASMAGAKLKPEDKQYWIRPIDEEKK